MSDVFIPPARFPGSGGAPAATSGVAATVTHPPPATAELATGAILRGTVLGTDARGQVLVKTDYGLLALQTQAQLAKGHQVILQVRVAGTELHVVILKVQADERALPRQRQPGEQPLPETPHSRSPQSSQSGTGAPPGGPLDELAHGRPLRAVVLRAEAPPAATTAPRNLEPGASVEVRILEVRTASGPASAPSTPPGTPHASGQSAAAGGQTGAASTTPGSGTAAATSTGPAPTAQADGARASVQASSPQPQPTPSGSQVGLPANTVEGLVARAGSGEGTMVQTPLGMLRLDAKVALAPGTRLMLQVSEPLQPPPTPPAEPKPALGASLARGWPALAESLEVLQVADPSAVALSLGTHAMPRPGPRLASTIMFFLAALKGGDLSVWLSNATAQALERAGRGDLVGRLKQDFARMSRLASEPASGEWRAFLVPIFDAGTLHQLRFFLRRPEADDDATDGATQPRATRFVVEVSLSRFGDLQFDGLIQQRRFDLILRSRRPLPEAIQTDIRRIFEDAGETTGYRGQLVFRPGTDWTLMPLSAMTAGEPGMVV